MSLPVKYLDKLSTYKIEVQGTPVKVRIAEKASLVTKGLKELKEKMGQCDVVGLDVAEGTGGINSYPEGQFETKNGIDVTELIKRVLKMTGPISGKLSRQAAMVGLSLEEPPKVALRLNAPAFSHDEVRFLIHNVYSSFVIAKKLLGSL